MVMVMMVVYGDTGTFSFDVENADVASFCFCFRIPTGDRVVLSLRVIHREN